MKKYWLYLFADTFVWPKNEDSIVYNSANGLSIQFKYAAKVRLMVDKLNMLESLYRIELTEDDLNAGDVKAFVDGIIKIKAGDLALNSPGSERPVSLKPELKIRDGVNYYKWLHSNGIGGSIIHNMNTLVFYINGSTHGSDSYYRQTVFPLKNAAVLDENAIVEFALNAKKSYFLSNISLVGNIWEYANGLDLVNRLAQLGANVTVYCTYEDALANKNNIGTIENEQVFLHVIASDYSKPIDLQKIWVDLNNHNRAYSFLVRNEAEYSLALEYIEANELQKADIVPVYAGDDLSFFEEYIYTTEDEILDYHSSRKEIFKHQALNTHFFGKLYILPNGEIYANVNNPAIGTIKDSPYSVVYKEMVEGKSWLYVRDKEPCSHCIYQWLCPSPSNYEYAIGKPNLCHVRG